MTKQLYDIGEMPPLGEVPEQMHAWLIRPERFGPPMQAFQKEVVAADGDMAVAVRTGKPDGGAHAALPPGS